MGSLFRFECKRLLRDKINWVFLFGTVALTMLGLWRENVTIFQSHRLLQQGMVWWAIFSAYRLAAANHDEVERTHPAAPLMALFGMFIAGTAVVGALSLVAYILSPLAVRVFLQALAALGLYYLLPMMIAGTVGWMIGQVVPHKIGYIAVGVISYFMGSLGSVWVYGLFEAVPSLLAISPTFGLPPGVSYTPIAGFDLSPQRWLKHLLWLSLALFCANLFFGRVNRRKPIGIVLLLTALVLGGAGVQEEMGPLRRVLIRDYSVVKEDHLAYMEIGENEFREPMFRWKSMDLTVDSSVNGLQVEGEGKLILLEDASELSFNLQQKLSPGTWHIEGKPIEPKQAGDVLRLSLPIPKKAGEEVAVRFEYGGIPYGEYTAKETAVILPNFHNWIPQPDTGQSLLFRSGTMISVPHHNAQPMEVALHWKKENPYWSNAYTGTTAHGVALIAGYVNQEEIDGITYVSTISDPALIQKNSKVLMADIKTAAKQLGMEVPEIKTVVSLDHFELRSEGFVGIGIQSRLAGDVLYVKGVGPSKPPFVHDDPERDMEFYQAEVIGALLMNQPKFLYLDEEMQNAFVHAYIYPYTQYVTKYISYPELIQFLQNEQDIHGFLRAWYQEMKDNTQYSQEDLQTLIMEWRDRR